MMTCVDLDLTPIPEGTAVDVSCPHCGLILSRIFSDRHEVPAGKPWLHDGDTLQVWSRLTPEQNSRARYASVMTGSCASCHGDYAVFDVMLLPGAFVEGGPAYQYLIGNQAGTDERNFSVSVGEGPVGEIIAWHLRRSTTPYGVLDAHSFGPVKLAPDDAIQTEFGTSACGGGSEIVERGFATVIPLWDRLCRLNDRAQDARSATAR